MPHKCELDKTARTCGVTHTLVVNKQEQDSCKIISVFIQQPRELPEICDRKQPAKQGSSREKSLWSTKAPACSTQKSRLSWNLWCGACVARTSSLWICSTVSVKINEIKELRTVKRKELLHIKYFPSSSWVGNLIPNALVLADGYSWVSLGWGCGTL